MLMKNVEHDQSANTKNIIVKYDDGTSDVLGKGVAIRLEDAPEEGRVNISMDMLKITPNDLRLVIISMLEFGEKLGLFHKANDDEEEAENDE